MDKITIDILNHNTLGYSFEAAQQGVDNEHVWVSVVDQDPENTKCIKYLEGSRMPKGFNNILVKTTDCHFFTIPYTLKYICL